MTTASTLRHLDELVDLTKTACLVIGYAGRDADSVQAHIDELAAIGVAPPAEIPMVYPVPTELLTSKERLTASVTSSGEVEPVIIRSSGRVYLGVGSDHTDRQLETEDVHRSKLACPKPVGVDFAEIDPSTFHWDACEISCSVDGRNCQSGTLASLRTPDSLLELLETRGVIAAGDDAVLFGGTVPLVGGEFVYGRSWTVSLTLPDGRVLEHTYEMTEDE